MKNTKRIAAEVARITAQMDSLDLPSGAFESVIKDLARCVVEADICSERLDEDGLTIVLPNGIEAAHPSLKVRDNLTKRIDRIRTDLGLHTRSLSQLTNAAKPIAAPTTHALKSKLKKAISKKDAPGISTDDIDDILNGLGLD